MLKQSTAGTLRRRAVIDIASRRQRPGMGSRRGKRKASDMAEWPDLGPILRGIPWAVVGAVAASVYMPERATRDLDIAVLASDREVVKERLRKAGYVLLAPLAIGGSQWKSPDGLDVDVIELDEVWAAEALDQAARNLSARDWPILSLSYLVLMKLIASRFIDIGDVGRMLGLASDEELADVRRVVGHYQPSLRDDLESLIVLGKMEQETE